MSNTDSIYPDFKSSVPPILDHFLAGVQKASIISSGNCFCNTHIEYTDTKTSKQIVGILPATKQRLIF